MFATRLKELRLGMNLTQKELAEILQTTRSTIAGYESSSKRRMPNADRLNMMANLFNVSIDYLLCRDVNGTPESNDTIRECRATFNLPIPGGKTKTIIVENDRYSRLGLFKGDVLVCKPVSHAFTGALVVTKSPVILPTEHPSGGLNLAYIKKMGDENLRAYCPINEQTHTISINLLGAVVTQIICSTPSLAKYERTREKHLG